MSDAFLGLGAALVFGPSVPIPKFVSALWRARTNFGIDQDTSKSKFLVCFTDLKFAAALDPKSSELQIQHTSVAWAVHHLACSERGRAQVVEHDSCGVRRTPGRDLRNVARFLRDRRGSSTAEYAVIAAIVATAILLTLAHARHA